MNHQNIFNEEMSKSKPDFNIKLKELNSENSTPNSIKLDNTDEFYDPCFSFKKLKKSTSESCTTPKVKRTRLEWNTKNMPEMFKKIMEEVNNPKEEKEIKKFVWSEKAVPLKMPDLNRFVIPNPRLFSQSYIPSHFPFNPSKPNYGNDSKKIELTNSMSKIILI